MSKTELKDHLEQAEIRKEMQVSESREQFQRWQAIYLVGKSLRVEQVAEYIGITKGTVYQWIFNITMKDPNHSNCGAGEEGDSASSLLRKKRIFWNT